jgi:hypothetical protein
MATLSPKFIICDNTVILGHVEFHKDLIPKNKGKDDCTILGGGWWYFDKPNNTLYLYGSSTDFKHVTQKQIDAAFFHERDNGVKIVFDPFIPTFEYLRKKYKLVIENK